MNKLVLYSTVTMLFAPALHATEAPTRHQRYTLPNGYTIDFEYYNLDETDCHDETNSEPYNDNQPPNHDSLTINRLFQATLLGATTGALCVYSDRAKFPLFPLNWLVCAYLRTLMVDTLHDEQLGSIKDSYRLTTTAWLADWITYILIKFRPSQRKGVTKWLTQKAFSFLP